MRCQNLLVPVLFLTQACGGAFSASQGDAAQPNVDAGPETGEGDGGESDAQDTADGADAGETEAGDIPIAPPVCTRDEVLCGGACVSRNDPAYGCGTCTPCALSHATAACKSGVCTVGACETGRSNCDNDATNGCEVDLANAPGNCGACSNLCPPVTNAAPTCANGQCGFTCNSGFTACGHACCHVATGLALGLYHACALTSVGGVRCWGINGKGELGNGSTTESHLPVDVSGLSSGVAAIAAGSSHTCALATGGGVKCWGLNDRGQLGNNSTANSGAPVDVAGLVAVGIAAGAYHTCAITSAGGVKCWGANYSGQLGNNTSGNVSSVPVNVSGLTAGVSSLALGSGHSCARTTGGGVKCWGYNGHGQIGNNSTTDSHVPVDVLGVSGVAEIATAVGHTCARTSGGAIQCWGWNLYGQLGDNSTTDSPVPEPVWGFGSSATAVAANGVTTCARTTAGGVKCWGANGNGQLGNNSNTDSHVPADVTELGSGVASIAAGVDYNCALMTGGNVKCWGQNNHGQLGNNATVNSLVPVDVTGL